MRLRRRLPAWFPAGRSRTGRTQAEPDRDHERPTTVTRERVAGVLDGRRERYGIDEDNDLTVDHDGNEVWFLLLGEREDVLQVRARWQRRYPLAAARALVRATNDWNRDHLWPKSYVHPESGRLSVYAEISTDLRDGVTTGQLAGLVDAALESTVGMFETFGAFAPVPREPQGD